MKLLAWRDVAVVAALLLIAGAVSLTFFFAGEAVYAEVWVDGELDMTIPLAMSMSGELHTPVPGVVIFTEDGRARFIKSDCRDQLCVRVGFLFTRGSTAVCLPNRVMLRITGEQSDKYDLLIG